MAIGFYIVPYRVTIFPEGSFPRAERTLDLNITAPALAGQWREVEILGNRAIVKINAGAGVLAQLDAVYKRLPKDDLRTSLSDLSTPVKNALRNEALDQGYTLQEINNRFPGNLGDYTLGDVLRFMATRRRKPLTIDYQTNTLQFDGDIVACEDVDALDRAVT